LLAEQLRRQWRARSAAGRIHDRPGFTADGLVLGAGTVLAKAGDDGGWLTDEEARLSALLRVAYGRPIGVESVAHLQAATARWRQGDRSRAALHLALSRCGPLAQPTEVARRLFMADGLMRAGVAPEAIVEALDGQAGAGDDAAKYNPEQPRVPAGSGRASGRWTSGGGGAAGTGAHPPTLRLPAGVAAAAAASEAGAAGIDLGALSAEVLAGVAALVTAIAEAGVLAGSLLVGGMATAVGIVVVPATGPKGEWVHVGGQGDLSYFRTPDETAIRFRYTTAEGEPRTFTTSPDPDGNYRDPNGNVIARWVKTAGKLALVISAAALVGYDTKRPNLCPEPKPDRPGARPKDQDFEDRMKAVVNPGAPTPRGVAYAFFNPQSGKFVVIDDCQRSTGIPFEYKGTGYGDNMVRNNLPGDGMKNQMMGQALSQAQATRGRPLVWVFAENDAAESAKAMFKSNSETNHIIVLSVQDHEVLK
jgi:hypothetical protein